MRKLLMIVCGVIVMSCSSDHNPIAQKDVYSVEKMEEVLLDIHMVEKALQLENVALDTAIAIYHQHYLPEICKRHQVTEEGINTSLRYYLYEIEDEEGMQKIYELITDTLSILEVKALKN